MLINRVDRSILTTVLKYFIKSLNDIFLPIHQVDSHIFSCINENYITGSKKKLTCRQCRKVAKTHQDMKTEGERSQ